MAGGGHHFAGWADINVPFSVVPKVFPRKRPILALRFVDDRDMRRNILLIDYPVERVRGAIGGSVMMMRMLDGNVIHTLVMPNGERSAQPPTAAQIRDW